MKKRKSRPAAQVSGSAAGASVQPRTAAWRWMFAAACAACFLAYLPAAGGPLLFDDLDLGFFLQSQPDWSVLLNRLARIVTTASLIAESRLAGLNPQSFHLTNVLIHLLNGFLVWRILEELLARYGRSFPGDRMAALAGAGFFLLHPLQTEAVAYISSRSEVLCALFAYAAFLVFLRCAPEEPAGWGRALAATALVGLSALSKEPGVAMAGVFLLFDVISGDRPSLRPLYKRWRLYAPMLAAATAVGAKLFLTLSREGTAGATAAHRPADYLLTQFEVVWHYVRLVIAPWGQNLDHAYPVVKAPGGVLTWLSLLGLAGTAALLWRMRDRWPLALRGFVFAMVLLAPTSSIVPIQDAMAERRLYLGFPGLAMIAAEFLRRLRPSWKAGAAIALALALLAGLTARRAGLYTSAVAMWEDSVRANPRNGRAWFQLAFAYYENGRCAEAASAYQKAGEYGPQDFRLLVNWANALECAGRAEEAVEKLKAAQKYRQPLAWVSLGRILARKGNFAEALEALNEALRLAPDNADALAYRGNVHLLRGDPAAALADYEQALRIRPDDTAAMKGRQAALAALGRAR
ncbi:MAG: tetratricopeptide repeat protein [Bryobacteraceae bacterium]|nr:tetratricopeptide repeat protein [Bryobacteraceae bacterium]